MKFFDRIASIFFLVAIISMALFFYLPEFPMKAIPVFGFLVACILFVIRTNKDSGLIKNQESQIQTILNSLKEGVIVYDQEFKILKFNRTSEEIFNLKTEEVLNQVLTLKDKSSLNPKMRTLTAVMFPALAETVVRKTNPGSFPQILDFTFSNPPLELRITTDRLLNPKGEDLGFIKLIQNKTRELKILKQKKEFITVASHQLQTPLTAINWSMEGLKAEDLTDSQKILVSSAQSGVNQLSKIVSNLLDITKIEEGHFGYEFKQIEIIEYLKKALEEVKVYAESYKVKTYLDQSGIENLNMEIDPIRLGLALRNILDNAIKYNIKNGEVILKIEKLPNEPFVQISIKDTGIGINEADINKMFGKFFRGDNAVKNSAEGNGLGLFIAKNIISRHGGSIWITSRINRGTIVYFKLPTDPKLIPGKEIIEEDE